MREHWEVSDLARMLVCLGAFDTFLRLGDPEALERFKAMACISRTLNSLDAKLGKASRTPHSRPGIGRSELIALRLRRGLVGIIATYARKGAAQENAMLAMFLQHGLITYSKQRTFSWRQSAQSAATPSTEESGKTDARTDLSDASLSHKVRALSLVRRPGWTLNSRFKRLF
jgi:hypothetical protein